MSVDELVLQLRSLGVRLGDLVMVHASMRRVGGRAEDLVAALDDAVGPQGTVLMVLGASTLHGAFDAGSTPADPEVGVLADVLRATPGTLVSAHPEGRFAARGALAAALTTDVPWHDYFGPGSPLERLVEHRGRVLRLGADPDTVTLFHHAEYLADLPAKRRVVRTPLVRLPDGRSARVRVECLDDSDGIVAWDGPDYFGLITAAYLATGRAAIGHVGGAVAELFDAGDALAFAVDWMERHLAIH